MDAGHEVRLQASNPVVGECNSPTRRQARVPSRCLAVTQEETTIYRTRKPGSAWTGRDQSPGLAEQATGPRYGPMRSPNRSRRLDLLSIALIALAGAYPYYSTMDGYFLTDEAVFVVDAHNRGLRGVPALFASEFLTSQKGTGEFGFYRPVPRVSFALDYAIWRVRPFGYHLTGLLLHILSAVLVMLLGWRLSGRRVVGLASGLLFAVHPSHAEAVSWIAGRCDLLATAFFLAALYSFVAYRDRARPSWCGALAVCYGLSLLSKESAVALPFVMLVCDLLRPHALARQEEGSPTLPRRVRLLAPYAIVLLEIAAYGLVRWLVLGTILGGHVGSRSQYVGLGYALRAAAEALRVLVSPVNRAILGDSVSWALLALTLGGLLFLAALTRKRDRSAVPLLLFYALMSMLCLVPALPLPLLVNRELCNSRILYLPSAGLCLLLGSALFLVPGSRGGRRARRGVLALFLVVYAGLLSVNCTPWVKAGRMSRAVHDGLLEFVESVGEDHLVAFLDPPGSFIGATLSTAWIGLLLSPPFAPEPYAVYPVRAISRFPGDDTFKEVLHQYPAESGRRRVYVTWWDHEAGALRSLPEPHALDEVRPSQELAWTGPQLADEAARQGLYTNAPDKEFSFPYLMLRPSLRHVVHVTLRTGQAVRGEPRVALSWADEASIGCKLVADADRHTYSFPVGFCPAWISRGGITRLTLQVQDCPSPVLLEGIEVTRSLNQGGRGLRSIEPRPGAEIRDTVPRFVFECPGDFRAVELTLAIEWPDGTVQTDKCSVRRDELEGLTANRYAWQPSRARYAFTMSAFGELLAQPSRRVDWWVKASRGDAAPVDTLFSARSSFYVGRP